MSDIPSQSAREIADENRGSPGPANVVGTSASNRVDFPGCSLCSPCESCDDECGCVPGPCWWCGHSGRSGADSKIADIPGALREEADP